ncbi:imidazolonepropionase [Mangrovibacter plantisponsor]|uniref:Imidazolonepropionase n=1 Tax=Mangrovibacter plantisponsor TaxID=451513 RepID=A0A317Q626_9ENTR|nr:imidazolonepropionase [Mangrovibacter plantisponsor]PWW11617.1 imidazolonepropionase [Mangrovibacter plantisponsor]
MLQCETLWTGADLVTLKDGKYHLIRQGAIAVAGERIVWVGEERDAGHCLPQRVEQLNGGIITPGLVDCHTHLVFGGDRSGEFEMRLNGASYAEIAASGGGIISTVNATRQASEAELLAAARERLRCLRQEGVTTLEIKSGYGLESDSELRMLRVIRQLAQLEPVDIQATFLAAHAVPPEYQNNADGWIDYICQTLLPAAHQQGLVDAVDGFCEHLAFSPEQITRVFNTARELNLPVKLHAEQLSSLGGSSLAARYQAISADHLEYATEDDVIAMAQSGTVAVLLPGAYYMLRETQMPPVELFRKHGVPMALASDLNPGTSPVLSLRLMLNMACTLFRMTPEEALAGVTLWGAKALGRESECGSLEAGKLANFVHWPVKQPAELAYWLGGQLPCQVVYRGESV